MSEVLAKAELQLLEPSLAKVLQRQSDYAPWFERKQLVSELQNRGLPRIRTERWKYQNPQPLVDAALQVSTQTSQITGENLIVVPFDSVHGPCLETIQADMETIFLNSSMTLLNGVLFSAGWVIEVPENSHARIQLSGEFSTVECVHITAHRGSHLEIEDTSCGGNQVSFISCAAGSRVELVRLQHKTEQPEFRHLTTTLHDASRFEYRLYGTGGPFRSNEMLVNCIESGSEVDLTGVWRTQGSEQVNHVITVNHYAPECTSNQVFRSVLQDESRSVFNGRIYIEEYAKKSEAHLENKNILIGNAAETYAKPELAILNDDVICSHGVSSGQLDPTTQFYLQSRGIPAHLAEEMLVKGFLSELTPNETGRQLLGL